MRQLIRRLLGAPARGASGKSNSGKARTAALPPRRARRHGLRSRRGMIMLGLAGLAAGGIAAAIYQLYRSGELSIGLARLEDRVIAGTARLGLAVADIAVEGRVMTTREAILRAVGAQRGAPILGVSPSQVKAQLEALPWVRSAAVERQLPDTLRIILVERKAFAFWQRDGKLALIDRDGVVITNDRLERFPGLLVLVGEDAPKHAAELIDMLSSEPDLAARVSAAVRVGNRRWNVHFDVGIDVELPEAKPDEAWAQLARLERTSRLLARDVQVVDMRLPDRLVVRVTPAPPKETPKKGRQAAKST
jgi:cell division protein FtsQ